MSSSGKPSAPPAGSAPKQNPVQLKVLDGQTEFVEEELEQIARFFRRWSREILWGIAIIVAIFFVVKSYHEGEVAERKATAAQFAAVRSTFGDLREAFRTLNGASSESKEESQKKVDELSVKFEEQLKSLGDGESPYREMVPVYRSALANLRGDVAAARQAFAAVGGGASLALVGDPERGSLPLELTLVNVGRTLLDGAFLGDPASPETGTLKGEGRGMLKVLVERGSFAPLSAATALIAFSESAEEKTEVKGLIEALFERRPELRDKLSVELDRVSASLGS